MTTITDNINSTSGTADRTDSVRPAAAVYLLPVPLSAGTEHRVLPDFNIAVIRQLRHFVVENVRSARRFLRACIPDFPIDDSTFTELSEHTTLADVDAMLAPVRAGHPIGVLSEAGCPAVADPGAAIVAAAQRAGIEVRPLVGPSSILMSLMASGFDGQSFAFSGYLPVDDSRRSARLRELERLAAKGQTQIFIETPYRNRRLVESMLRTLSDSTLLCIATDITGPRQNIVTRTIAGWRRQGIPDCDKVPTIFLIGSSVARP